LYDLFVANFPDDGKNGPSGDKIFRLSFYAITFGMFFILLGSAIILFAHWLKPELTTLDYKSCSFAGRALCCGALVYVGFSYAIVLADTHLGNFSGRQMNGQARTLLRGLDAYFWIVLGAGVTAVFESRWPLNNNSLVILLVSFVLFCSTIHTIAKYSAAVIVFKVLYVLVIAGVCLLRQYPGLSAFVSDTLRSEPTSTEKHNAAARIIQGTEIKEDKIILGRLYDEALQIRRIVTQNNLDECTERQVAELKTRLRQTIEGLYSGDPVKGCEPTSNYWAGRREAAVTDVLAGKRTINDEDLLGAVLPDVVELARLREAAVGRNLTRCESRRLSVETARIDQFKAKGRFDAQLLKLKACAIQPPPVNDDQDVLPGFGSDEGYIK
jgi:hypothetical protein